MTTELVRNKTFHSFISYRVKTDAALAERMTDKLQALTILNEQRKINFKCFFDKQNLVEGREFEEQFLDGLNSSCLFLPIISEACLESLLEVQPGSNDNLVLEWQTALALHKQGMIEIVPILVGSTTTLSTGETAFKRFNGFATTPKLVQSVQEVVASILKFQGIFLNPQDLADKLAVIQSRFSNEIWSKYRAAWANEDELGPEPTFTCVQCGQGFVASGNGVGACRFHSKSGGQCCGKTGFDNGCIRAKHSSTHHNTFEYEAFWKWRNNIVNYVDKSKAFAVVAADDVAAFENASRTVNASCGAVLSGAGGDADKLYVDAGFNGKHFFMTYSSTDIGASDISKPLFELKGPLGEWSTASWVVDADSEIVGVKLECSTQTSVSPSTVTVLFQWPSPSLNNGPTAESVTFSKGPQFGEVPLPISLVDSSNPYNLPLSKLVSGIPIQELVPRKGEDLPSYASPSTVFRAKVLSSAVRHESYQKVDIFTIEVSVINRSKEATSVLDARAFARLRVDNSNSSNSNLVVPETGAGEEDGADFVATGKWKRVDKLTVGVNLSTLLPAAVPASGASTFVVTVSIPTARYYVNGEGYSNIRNHSWIAFKSGAPVVLDIEFKDLCGEKFGALVEFPVGNIGLRAPAPETIFSLAADDSNVAERELIDVRLNEANVWDAALLDASYLRDHSVDFSAGIYNPSMQSRKFGVPTLRHWVLLAERKLTSKSNPTHLGILNVSEYLFGEERKDGQFRYFADAIVDFSRRSVVAIRFKLQSKVQKSVGYFYIPAYGDALEPAENEYGLESVDENDAVVEGWLKEESEMADNVVETIARVQQKFDIPPRVSFANEGNGTTTATSVGSNDLTAVLKPLLAQMAKEITDKVTASFKEEIQGLVEKIKQLEADRK